MTTNPEEHDFIQQVCSEPTAEDLALIAAGECRPEELWGRSRRKLAAQIKSCADACDRGLPMLPVKFDEAAERARFEVWYIANHGDGAERLKKCVNAPDVYYYAATQGKWNTWLACAKSRHNESTMQGEE